MRKQAKQVVDGDHLRRKLKYPDVHVRFSRPTLDLLEYLEQRAKIRRISAAKMIIEILAEEICRNPL